MTINVLAPNDLEFNDERPPQRAGTKAGLWNDPNFPKSGWSLFDSVDAGSKEHRCQMCQYVRVRYFHILRHPDHPDCRLYVGCECASRMVDGPQLPRERERHLRRRAAWLEREWRLSKTGNEFLNVAGWNVTVFLNASGWNYRLSDRAPYEPRPTIWGPGNYPTAQQAKAFAFDRLVEVGAL